MPANNVTGTRGLALVREERAALEAREKQYRQEAAIELGEVALAAGVEAFAAVDLKAVLVAAKALGPTRAIDVLKAAQASVPAARTNGAGHKPAAESGGNLGA